MWYTVPSSAGGHDIFSLVIYNFFSTVLLGLPRGDSTAHAFHPILFELDPGTPNSGRQQEFQWHVQVIEAFFVVLVMLPVDSSTDPHVDFTCTPRARHVEDAARMTLREMM